MVWEKTFGDGLDQGCDIMVDPSGALILARDYILSCNNDCSLNAINLIRINHQGDSLWSKHLGSVIAGEYYLGKFLEIRKKSF